MKGAGRCTHPRIFKSDGQEISTIEWQELKNEFRLFSDYKKLLRTEEI